MLLRWRNKLILVVQSTQNWIPELTIKFVKKLHIKKSFLQKHVKLKMHWVWWKYDTIVVLMLWFNCLNAYNSLKPLSQYNVRKQETILTK